MAYQGTTNPNNTANADGSNNENNNDPSNQEDITVSPSSGDASAPVPGLRRSSRTPKERVFFCSSSIQGKDIVSEIVQRCGLDQPGRNYLKDPQKTEDSAKGRYVYEEYLKPDGWWYKANTATSGPNMEADWVFSNGIIELYGYIQIYEMWKKDKALRNRYLGNHDTSTPEAVVLGASPPTTNARVAENQSLEYSSLGQPTPGVPVAASRPAECTPESETMEDQESATPNREAKRGRPTARSSKGNGKKRRKSSSKEKGNKRHKKQGSPIMIPPVTAQDPTVVTPTSARDQSDLDDASTMESNFQEDGTDALCLPKDNGTIIKLQKQLQQAQKLAEHAKKLAEGYASRLAKANDGNKELKKELEQVKTLEQARYFEIEDLKGENDNLRKDKANEKVKVRKLTEQRDLLNEEIEQMRMNHAMEQGFQDGGEDLPL